MSKPDIKYLNFPIQLLKGFILDHLLCMAKIALYTIYAHSIKLKIGTEIEKIQESINFFDLSYDPEAVLKYGKPLYEKKELLNSPIVGFNIAVFLDYKCNFKTEFEKVSLLAYLSLKSIIQVSDYKNVSNNFLLSRMDGNASSCDISELSPEIFKYSTRRYLDKIKQELEFNWYLTYYARKTKGFYVSFKLDYEQIATIVEKQRTSVLDENQRLIKKEIEKKVLENIHNRPLK